MPNKVCKDCDSYTIRSSVELGGLATSNYGFCKLRKKPVDFWSTCDKVDVRGNTSSEVVHKG